MGIVAHRHARGDAALRDIDDEQGIGFGIRDEGALAQSIRHDVPRMPAGGDLRHDARCCSRHRFQHDKAAASARVIRTMRAGCGADREQPAPGSDGLDVVRRDLQSCARYLAGSEVDRADARGAFVGGEDRARAVFGGARAARRGDQSNAREQQRQVTARKRNHWLGLLGSQIACSAPVMTPR
jgi:hypothetical protein